MSWLRWNLRCLRGYLCPHIIVKADVLAPGLTLSVAYSCRRCRSRYLWDSKGGRRRLDEPRKVFDQEHA